VTTLRRSRDETRALMLDAGMEVLLRDGINLGASTLRYADAFELLKNERDIKVTRGSVHERIWSSQEAWQFDVLAASINSSEAIRRSATNTAVAEHIAELPVDTETERWNLLAESCRVGSHAFLKTIEDHPPVRLFPTVIAAWKASANNVAEYDQLSRLLAETQRSAVQDLQDGLTGLLELADLEVEPSHGLSFNAAVRFYSVNTTALAYSHTLRSLHDPALAEPISARCPDGAQRDWNHLGLGNWLVARGLFRTRHREAGAASPKGVTA